MYFLSKVVLGAKLLVMKVYYNQERDKSKKLVGFLLSILLI